jgi:cytochrome P450
LQQRLRDEPDLIDAFVEEALRLESPFHGHFRVTTRDCELSGVKLEKGRRLMLLWSSANRDATVFDAPDAVDVSRKRPRAHVAFGHGIHQCIGAALARMEAQCAIRILLQRTKDIRLAPGNDFRHVPSLFTRGLQRLDISFDAA